MCLPGTDNGEGLTLRVDTMGGVHLSRIALASGNLSYTTIGPDDRVESEMVARRISISNHCDDSCKFICCLPNTRGLGWKARWLQSRMPMMSGKR